MQPPSRRTFLALGLITLTSACTGSPGGDPDGDVVPGNRRPGPDPDLAVRLRALAATDTLLAAYGSALAAPDARTALLQPLRAETAQHRAALAYGVPAASVPPTSAATTPAANATPTATTTPAAPATPAALAALERRTAQSRLAELGAARPPLARLLASVAAANTLHATALDPTDQGIDQPAGTTAPTPAAPGTGSTPGTDSVPALQNALGAEHAAVYGYGVVGAHLSEDRPRADARTAHAAHQAQRDAWQRLLTALGATPTPAAGGYQLPFPVTDAPAATRLAAHLETRLSAVYADLVAALPAAQRPTAATALRDCALRARRWGAPDTAFPGIPETVPTPTAATPRP
ncbi:DUF4439 domain-containing protein [Kitasatospora sp. NPDC048194]|uniref:DUF4439 domain-containing protein n=1 Tax=Kitasatospora sp. NPDC048194 TaxID=3364045 RepID=UPI00371B185C